VVTATAGVATDEGNHESAEELLRDADIAMYHAKAAERGTFAFFDEAMHADAVRRLQLTGELRTALAEGQFEVHYQPIVDLVTGHGSRFEALLRWRHPERGLVTPDQFLPLLLETGMIVAVGRWLVDDVCRQLAEWGPAVTNVAINLSDREFWQAHLLEGLTAALERHGIGADRLTLEITEGVVMHQPDTAQQLMRTLHAAGFELHVDDFGTGTSSLDSLHRFKVDALKIDRSFVARVGGGTRSEELIRAILAMATALGLDVVAEGVESEEQVQFLLRAGCRSAQGWLFGRPMPAADVLGWVEQPPRSLPRPA
jgi:EAL domain-containing protein (putative c-di-GMP-specific phosphodiesterase class I)